MQKRRDCTSGGVFGALCILSLLSFYPGWLSFDGAYQFWQARHGHFNNLSSVTLPWLWSGLISLTGWQTPLLLFVPQQIAFWFGLGLLFSTLAPSRLAIIIGGAALLILAPVWIVLGHLWTDAQMLGAATLALGLSTAAASRRRPVMHIIAVLPLIYAATVRLNAWPTMLPLFLFWAWCAPFPGIGRHYKMAALGVATGALFLAISIDRLVTVERVRTLPIQMLHDLVGISIRTERVVLPAFSFEPTLTVANLKNRYMARAAPPIFFDAPHIRSGLAGDAYSDAETIALGKFWLRAIAENPLAYLAHRCEMMHAALVLPTTGNDSSFAPIDVHYKDNPKPSARTGPGRALTAWLGSDGGRLICGLMPALFIAFACALILWHRFRLQAGCPNLRHGLCLTLLVSAAIQVGPLLIFAPSAEYRYAAWAGLCAVLSLLVLNWSNGEARHDSAES